LEFAQAHGMEVRFVANVDGPIHVEEQVRLAAPPGLMVSYESPSGDEYGDPAGSGPWNGPRNDKFRREKVGPEDTMVIWLDLELFV
jgi:hypothetical protein